MRPCFETRLSEGRNSRSRYTPSPAASESPTTTTRSSLSGVGRRIGDDLVTGPSGAGGTETSGSSVGRSSGPSPPGAASGSRPSARAAASVTLVSWSASLMLASGRSTQSDTVRRVPSGWASAARFSVGAYSSVQAGGTRASRRVRGRPACVSPPGAPGRRPAPCRRRRCSRASSVSSDHQNWK